MFVLTSAVKLFFRDLKDPLIPQDVRDVLVEAQPGAPVHETSKLLQAYYSTDWENWLGNWENLEPMMQQLHTFFLFLSL